MMSLVADSLVKKDSYVWGNIFAPSEIIAVLRAQQPFHRMSVLLSGRIPS